MEIKNPSIEHKVIEIKGLESESIWKSENLLPKIKSFCEKMELNVLSESFHDFEPQGTTLVFILSESHLAVHTWPECDYLHIDLVTCSHLLGEDHIKEALKETFGVTEDNLKIRSINYGN